MKKTLTTLFLLGLLVADGYAQSNVYLKLYQNTDFFKRTENLYNRQIRAQQSTEYNMNSFSRMSVAVAIETKNAWNHEFEVSYYQGWTPIEHTSIFSKESAINIANNVFEKENVNHFIAMHYEAYRTIIPGNRIAFQTGIGLNTYWAKSESRPESSFLFRQTDRNVGTTFTVIPRLCYALSQKFNLELSTKLGLLNANHYKAVIDNTTISAEDRIQESGMHWRFLPAAYNFRLGIAYKIR